MLVGSGIRLAAGLVLAAGLLLAAGCWLLDVGVAVAYLAGRGMESLLVVVSMAGLR
jgi:hypothetical protein